MGRKHKNKNRSTLVLGTYFGPLWNKVINTDCDDTTVKTQKNKKEKVTTAVHIYEECPVEPLKEE